MALWARGCAGLGCAQTVLGVGRRGSALLGGAVLCCAVQQVEVLQPSLQPWLFGGWFFFLPHLIGVNAMKLCSQSTLSKKQRVAPAAGCLHRHCSCPRLHVQPGLSRKGLGGGRALQVQLRALPDPKLRSPLNVCSVHGTEVQNNVFCAL